MTLSLLRRWSVLLAGLMALVAAGPAARAADRPPVILISLDGFRWDYLDRGVSPNLSALAAGGVRAERMLSSFPTVTFPNHYTLVTGLYPDHHGVVFNTFEDPAVPGGVFTMANHDERWWNQATPLWITAEQQGVKSGLMFWPGSEVAFAGRRATWWSTFDHGFPPTARVDKVLSWFSLPRDQQPGFVTLYFEAVDSAGHAFGPDTPQVNQAIGEVDAAVGRLVEGLKARGVTANLVIVADHGMATVEPGHTVMLDDVVDLKAVHPVFEDAVSGLDIPPTPAGEAARKALLAPHDHMTCWNQADIPARLHYGTNARVPDVVCLAETGWLIETRERVAAHPVPIRGEHGYDFADPRMGALFIANGPSFQQGLVIKPFPNVDVYPLLADLIGVTPQPNDGRLSDLAPILK